MSNSPLTYTAVVVVDAGFVCIGVKDNPDTWRERLVGGCWGFRQTEPDQTGLVHSWIQDLPDHTYTVIQTYCLCSLAILSHNVYKITVLVLTSLTSCVSQVPGHFT